MRASNVVPVAALVAVALGLLIVDVTTRADWAWWAIGIALAATLRQVLGSGWRACSTADR